MEEIAEGKNPSSPVFKMQDVCASNALTLSSKELIATSAARLVVPLRSEIQLRFG